MSVSIFEEAYVYNYWITPFFVLQFLRFQYIQLPIFLWLIILVPCVDFIVKAEQLHFDWCCTAIKFTFNVS